jgi:hypothetical protein
MVRLTDRAAAPTLTKLFGNESSEVTFETPSAYDVACQALS